MRESKNNANHARKKEAEECFLTAMAALERGERETAVRRLFQAIEIWPDCVEAYNNLGLIFKEAGQVEQAEACLLKAIQINDCSLKAFYNLAGVYQDGEYLSDAEICFRRVLELDPTHANAYNNLGVLLEKSYRLAEAEDCYRSAMKWEPEYAPPYFNLGKVLQITNRLAEADQCFTRAISLDPRGDHLNLGMAFFYLLTRRYDEGWKKYAEVLQRQNPAQAIFGLPIWRGEALGGKRILLYYEQGLGDTLQFIRYAEAVVRQGAEVSLWVQPSLQRLLATAFSPLPIFCDERALACDYDYICELHRLPIVLAATDETIPYDGAYVQALAADQRKWAARLADCAKQKYRVGVVWGGNPGNPMDRYRSIPFDVFGRLFDNTEIAWISLQVGQRARDCRAAAPENLVDLADELNDFCDTAGVVSQLDLVITMDTSIAHLAGAMGKPTWLLLDAYSDWRWQLERNDSPWYPTMKLFRQRTLGDWPEVMERVAAELAKKTVKASL